MYRLMVADVDSPSYFVATAAVKLGFFEAEGVDVEFVPEYGAKSGPETAESSMAGKQEIVVDSAVDNEQEAQALGSIVGHERHIL